MVKKIIATGLVALLTGCSTYRPHTASEKNWFTCMVAGQGSDYYTTKIGEDRGFVEGNPLYRNSGDVLIGKLGIVGFCYIAGQIDPNNRKFYYKVGALTGVLPATWNTYQMVR